MSDVVRVERRGTTAVVTIDRPEVRNAVSPQVTAEMTAAFDELDPDASVRAIVVTGSGPTFCAGADLKLAAKGKIRELAHPDYGFAGITQRSLAKPTIAAANGDAFAGGFEIVLACDLVVAAEQARFGIPEVRRGLMAVAGALVRLPKRIPIPVAKELAMTGDPIDAARAFQLGVVNRVVPAAAVVDEAVAMAERIGEHAPLAVRMSKRILEEALERPEPDAWERQWELSREVFAHPDALEGPRAFAEKRAPNWTST